MHLMTPSNGIWHVAGKGLFAATVDIYASMVYHSASSSASHTPTLELYSSAVCADRRGLSRAAEGTSTAVRWPVVQVAASAKSNDRVLESLTPFGDLFQAVH